MSIRQCASIKLVHMRSSIIRQTFAYIKYLSLSATFGFFLLVKKISFNLSLGLWSMKNEGKIFASSFSNFFRLPQRIVRAFIAQRKCIIIVVTNGRSF